MTDEEFEQQNEYEDSLQERIKELEEKVEYYKNCYEGCVNNHKYIMEGQRELSFNLYTALVKELEKQGLTDDIPSVIDQLVGKNSGKYADMYNEYKNQNKELELYKKALELALQCIDNDNINCEYCVHYNINECCNKNWHGTRPCKECFKEWLLQQAKEWLDEKL